MPARSSAVADGRTNVQLILAGFIRIIGYGFAVGRPDGKAFGDLAGLREVVRFIFISAYGQHFAAPAKQRLSAVRRNIKIADPARRLDGSRFDFGKLAAGNFDRHKALLTGL